MNWWCKLWKWDEQRWRKFCHDYGYHFTLKGKKYLLHPGHLVWYLWTLLITLVPLGVLGYLFLMYLGWYLK